MNYIVYKVVNKVNGKTYIGKHQTDNIYDDYLGSGKYLQRAINKYGKDCFEKIVLYVFDNKKDMDDKEAELVTDEEVKDKMFYNLKKGGEGGWDYINDGSVNHIQRCVEAGKKGYETILKKYGKDELDKIRSKNLLGYLLSDDPEIKKKRSENSRLSFKGRTHTTETKRKIGEKNSIKQRGQKNSQYNTCWIYSDNEKMSKKIKKDDIDNYIGLGWQLGRKMNFKCS